MEGGFGLWASCLPPVVQKSVEGALSLTWYPEPILSEVRLLLLNSVTRGSRGQTRAMVTPTTLTVLSCVMCPAWSSPEPRETHPPLTLVTGGSDTSHNSPGCHSWHMEAQETKLLALPVLLTGCPPGQAPPTPASWPRVHTCAVWT